MCLFNKDIFLCIKVLLLINISILHSIFCNLHFILRGWVWVEDKCRTDIQSHSTHTFTFNLVKLEFSLLLFVSILNFSVFTTITPLFCLTSSSCNRQLSFNSALSLPSSCLPTLCDSYMKRAPANARHEHLTMIRISGRLNV
jgi:hypothetical protein